MKNDFSDQCSVGNWAQFVAADASFVRALDLEESCISAVAYDCFDQPAKLGMVKNNGVAWTDAFEGYWHGQDKNEVIRQKKW